MSLPLRLLSAVWPILSPLSGSEATAKLIKDGWSVRGSRGNGNIRIHHREPWHTHRHTYASKHIRRNTNGDTHHRRTCTFGHASRVCSALLRLLSFGPLALRQDLAQYRLYWLTGAQSHTALYRSILSLCAKALPPLVQSLEKLYRAIMNGPIEQRASLAEWKQIFLILCQKIQPVEKCK